MDLNFKTGLSTRLFNGGLNWQIQFSLNREQIIIISFQKVRVFIIILVFLQALDLNIYYKFY